MIIYKASEDQLTKSAESFANIFRSEQEVFVELPGSTAAIRIPNEAECDAYWYRGPSSFASSQRFEEVRAYMRHYFVDAESAPKYWERNAQIDAAICAALENHAD